jgi:phosphate transport system substrate-binding protein
VLPYAQNISAALEAAQLRPDLSQELSGVYTSGNPDAYPISAYSYLVTQCANSGPLGAQRATCKGAYGNAGVTETLSKWMRYIACEGQVNMARIGYSPLPPNLSQELVNSIARMQGTAPEGLNAGNCANPRFRGSLGVGATSPKADPLLDRQKAAAAAKAAAGATKAKATGPTAGNAAAAAGPNGATAAAAGALAAGREGAIPAVGGGSGVFQPAAPVVYNRPTPGSSSSLPVLLLVLLVGLPPVLLSRRDSLPGWLRRASPSSS